jgi:hypothetical protein
VLDIQGLAPITELAKLFAVQGKMPLALDHVVVPVVGLGDVGDTIAFGPLGWGSCHMIGGGALNNSKVEIALPVTNQSADTFALIQSIYVRGGANGAFVIIPSPGLAAPTDHGDLAWRDNRTRGVPQLLIEGKNDSVPDLAVGPIRRYINANTNDVFHLDWLIGQNPDTGLQQGLYLEFTALNTTLHVNVAFREKSAR